MNLSVNMEAWQRRIARAEELKACYAFAGEILGFYAAIARFQAKFYRELADSELVREVTKDTNPFARSLNPRILKNFPQFLWLVEENAPEKLRDASLELERGGERYRFEILTEFWAGNQSEKASDRGTQDFFARAFLQPYAAAVREQAGLKWNGPTAYACPFCKRKPALGVLRPLGEGGQRLLMCSLCFGEWEFRRILCPGCGEGDPAKLPVYTAEELQHVRVECCDSCKTYIKTVDFTKSALGEPIVDEIASVPLDLWAQGRGYRKAQVNLMQL
jgi:formate dehydrogenase accessory protein FdhE